MTFDDEPFHQSTAPPRPAFIDPKTYAQAQAKLAAEETHGARKWWNELTPDDQSTMTELFQQSIEYTQTKELFDWSWNRGKAPLFFVNWARKQAQLSRK